MMDFSKNPCRAAQSTTPLMAQYWSLKNLHQDKLLLFQMGDFYEMFYEDARVGAKVLQVVLTTRNKKDPSPVPMCGVPVHSVGGAVQKLLNAGHRVALAAQVEAADKGSKVLVKREVVRVLSPGMVYDPQELEGGRGNYLCAFSDRDVAFLDFSTLEAFYYVLGTGVGELTHLLSHIRPCELVLRPQQMQGFKKHLKNKWQGAKDCTVSVLEDSTVVVGGTLRKEPRPLGSGEQSGATLRAYVGYMQGLEAARAVGEFKKRDQNFCMRLEPQVLRALEVFEVLGDTSTKGTGSVFDALNETRTAAGARVLKHWLSFPSMQVEVLRERHSRVGVLAQNFDGLKALRKAFSGMGDVARLLGKLRFNARMREVLGFKKSLQNAGECLDILSKTFQQPVGAAGCEDLLQFLQSALEDGAEPALHYAGDGLLGAPKCVGIKRGFSKELDACQLREQEICAELKAWEEKERAGTGFSKIKYNQVHGFFVELGKAAARKRELPQGYERRQTLAQVERFSNKELDAMGRRLLEVRARREELSHAVIRLLGQRIVEHSEALMNMAQCLAEWDVLAGFAYSARLWNYVKPELVQEHEALHLEAARHLVVERSLGASQVFVPNSCVLKAGESWLLTGPNMAGKSTFMRQVALCVLCAQVGAWVPAARARLPVFDAIFTRIGASDSLSEGKSTFMVEMSEVARVLSTGTRRSLVVLDEVGRGTSAGDGLCLAQAILEYCLKCLGARILFATHYAALSDLGTKWQGLCNKHMGVRRGAGGDLEFLYTLEDGVSESSYGIEVAAMAGLPKELLVRAQQLKSRFGNQVL